MSGDYLIQQLINAVSLGSMYAVLALGLAMVFSVLGLLNFAYGELITVTGYTMLFCSLGGWPIYLAAIAGVGAAIALALLTQLVAFRPLRGAPAYAVIFASFAVSIMLQSLFRGLISPRAKGVPVPPGFDATLDIGITRVPASTLITLVVAVIAMLSLGAFLRWAPQGLAIRASAEDMTTARLMGARAGRMIMLAFVLSGLLAGIAGVLWIWRTGSVAPQTGFNPLLQSFIAVVLGGLGKLRGAVIGGFVLAFIEVVLQVLLPANLVPFSTALSMLAVVIILFVRPDGLTKAVKERVA